MPANYTLLEKITVGAAGATSVTFSGIPQTGYTDLVVKMSARSNSSGGHGYSAAAIKFNGSTSNYSRRFVYQYGNGVVGSNSPSNGEWLIGVPDSTYTASTFGNAEMYIPNYTSANYKSISADGTDENNSSTEVLGGLMAGLWSDTAAITSIDITPASGSFVQYTTFYLYGVAKLGTTPAIVPYATGGDTIMTDGTYWYHAFLSSGTFTPQKGISCDVLVVAGGGGGGGNDAGGGGGAGGILGFASQSLSASNYTVTIGAGGAAQTSGADSLFGALTTCTGGGKGANATNNGANGGSGGGGGTGSGTGGTGSQGSNGGTGFSSTGGTTRGAGGGGGAGAVGSNGASGAGGVGGAGVNTVTNWGALATALTATGLGVSGYVAGGGGGGSSAGSGSYAGGSGGGGAGSGAGTVNGVAGTVNTGSGGGGGGTTAGVASSNGGAGGSGLVIVRYAI